MNVDRDSFGIEELFRVLGLLLLFADVIPMGTFNRCGLHACRLTAPARSTYVPTGTYLRHPSHFHVT
jgi:hypothetical protein